MVMGGPERGADPGLGLADQVHEVGRRHQLDARPRRPVGLDGRDRPCRAGVPPLVGARPGPPSDAVAGERGRHREPAAGGLAPVSLGAAQVGPVHPVAGHVRAAERRSIGDHGDLVTGVEGHGDDRIDVVLEAPVRAEEARDDEQACHAGRLGRAVRGPITASAIMAPCASERTQPSPGGKTDPTPRSGWWCPSTSPSCVATSPMPRPSSISASTRWRPRAAPRPASRWSPTRAATRSSTGWRIGSGVGASTSSS